MTDEECCEAKRLANAHVIQTQGDDCLCNRTVSGTKVGEHLYVACCCSIADGFIAGYAAACDAKRAEIERGYALDEVYQQEKWDLIDKYHYELARTEKLEAHIDRLMEHIHRLPNAAAVAYTKAKDMFREVKPG